MKLISWNVNGFRANLAKGFEEHFKALDADMFCIQETKMQPEQVTTKFDGYEQYFNSAVKKGYSGTALFTKQTPEKITFNYGVHTDEGRTIIAEYAKFILVNIYVPNAQRELTRLGYRMEWESEFPLSLFLKIKDIASGKNDLRLSVINPGADNKGIEITGSDFSVECGIMKGT